MPSVFSGNFHLAFTNIAGTHFSVLMSFDPTLPLGNWTVLGAATEGPPGSFQFTDLNAAGNIQRFYRVRSP